MTERSEKFEKVQRYYELSLWNETQVKNAVGRWITEEEYEEITGKAFQ